MADDVSEYEVLLGLVERVKLPAQPKVLLAISDEMKKEHPSFERIAGLIEQDPALAAKVLKVVNSPFYRTSDHALPSMIQALSILGLRNFYCVVLTSCLRNVVGVTEATINLWNHTLVVAKTCEMIARTTRTASPEAAYLAGLFHDSSIPMLLEKEPRFEQSMRMVVSLGGDVEAFEQKNFNTSHAVVSYLLARSWQLPEVVCDAIQQHHNSDLAVFPSDRSRRLGAALMLADHLARPSTLPDAERRQADDFWHHVEADVLYELGLRKSEVEEFSSFARECAVKAS